MKTRYLIFAGLVALFFVTARAGPGFAGASVIHPPELPLPESPSGYQMAIRYTKDYDILIVEAAFTDTKDIPQLPDPANIVWAGMFIDWQLQLPDTRCEIIANRERVRCVVPFNKGEIESKTRPIEIKIATNFSESFTTPKLNVLSAKRSPIRLKDLSPEQYPSGGQVYVGDFEISETMDRLIDPVLRRYHNWPSVSGVQSPPFWGKMHYPCSVTDSRGFVCEFKAGPTFPTEYVRITAEREITISIPIPFHDPVTITQRIPVIVTPFLPISNPDESCVLTTEAVTENDQMRRQGLCFLVDADVNGIPDDREPEAWTPDSIDASGEFDDNRNAYTIIYNHDLTGDTPKEVTVEGSFPPPEQESKYVYWRPVHSGNAGSWFKGQECTISGRKFSCKFTVVPIFDFGEPFEMVVGEDVEPESLPEGLMDRPHSPSLLLSEFLSSDRVPYIGGEALIGGKAPNDDFDGDGVINEIDNDDDHDGFVDENDDCDFNQQRYEEPCEDE